MSSSVNNKTFMGEKFSANQNSEIFFFPNQTAGLLPISLDPNMTAMIIFKGRRRRHPTRKFNVIVKAFAAEAAPVLTSDQVAFDSTTTFTRCQFCNHCIQTNVRPEFGACAWIGFCWAIAMLGPIASCFPCMFDRCMDVKHDCPVCGKFLGEYKIV